jgi:hypothetical protein
LNLELDSLTQCVTIRRIFHWNLQLTTNFIQLVWYFTMRPLLKLHRLLFHSLFLWPGFWIWTWRIDKIEKYRSIEI